MVRTEEIKVYSFDELSEEVKEKVLNDFREREDFYFLYDLLHDDLKYLLNENKINVLNDSLKLYYSLNYCQGDGLKFLGKFKYKNYYIYIKDGHLSNYYNHKYTTDITINTNHGNDAKEEVYNTFKELYYTICDKLEKDGYNYIDDALSDDAIKENIKLNDYEFFENGDLF